SYSRDWSSDVCSSDLERGDGDVELYRVDVAAEQAFGATALEDAGDLADQRRVQGRDVGQRFQEAGVLEVLVGQQPREPGVGEEMPEGEADQPVHGLDGPEMVEAEGAFTAPDLLVGVEQYGAVQLLLVAEIVVEQPLVGGGTVGDRVDTRALETALAEFHPRCREDFGARLAGVALPARRFAGLSRLHPTCG